MTVKISSTSSLHRFFGIALLILIVNCVMPMSSASILKIVGFRVPSLVLYGSDVDLDCPFSSPGRMKLYSLKWYQNSDEFYRYMFSDQTPVVAFTLPGIKVDLSKSNSSRVRLKSVNFNTTATFRCEVSADEPDFQTIQRRANMTVIHVSEDGPLITGLRDRYELNEQLDVNCTSPFITPDIGSHQIRLAWLINHDTISEGEVTKLVSLNPGNLSASTTTTINLRMTLLERHFNSKTGLMKLNCTMTIGRSTSSQFNKSLELMAALIHPTPALEPRPTSSERASSSKGSISASFSSGDRGRCQLSLVTFMIVFSFLFQFLSSC